MKTDAEGKPVLDENGNEIHTGYFWLSYYDKSISHPESFEFVKGAADKTYTICQHDLTPVAEIYDTEVEDEIRMANVFRTDAAALLEDVSCLTTRPGTEVTYNVYLLPEDDPVPGAGALVSTMKRTYEYGGYHRETLETPVRLQPGQAFAVEVIEKAGELYTVSMQLEWSESASRKYGIAWHGNAVVNEGESFLFEGGAYRDLSDESLQEKLLKDDYEEVVLDNPPIKAYLTHETEDHQPLNDLRLRLLGGNALTMSESGKEGFQVVRFVGTSDVPAGKLIQWDCPDPEILEIAPSEFGNQRIDLTAKKVGVARVTATMEGVGTSVRAIKVLPPAPEILSLETDKTNLGTLTVTCTDQSELGVDGYEIEYCMEGSDEPETVCVEGGAETSVVLEELEKGKGCAVTVRSYVDTPIGKLYSKPSETMTVQIPAASVNGSFDGGALTAEIAASGEAMLIASSCASDGRAAETKLIVVESAGEAVKTTVETGLTQEDGFSYKLMLVSKEGFAPLCEAWSNP